MAVVPTGFDMRLGARMRKRGPRIGCLLGAFSVASIFAVCLWWTFQPGSGEYGTSLTMVAEDGFGFALFFAGFITAMAGSYLFLTWRLVLFIRSSWRAGGIPRGVLVTFGFLICSCCPCLTRGRRFSGVLSPPCGFPRSAPWRIGF